MRSGSAASSLASLKVRRGFLAARARLGALDGEIEAATARWEALETIAAEG